MLALLVAQYRRIDLAEEGLADAFETAVGTWSERGEPANPAAWVLTVARRKITDRLRSESVLARRAPLLAVDAEMTAHARQESADAALTDIIGDELLSLVLLCTHPRLSREAAAALTLRLVLGISTAEIARLFLVPPPTMAARLTRAKQKLAGARFAVPTGGRLRQRLTASAEIAYLAFTTGYAPGSGPDAVRVDVAGEAIRLVRVIRSVAPDSDAELDALLALMLLQHSRRDARAPRGELVMLPEQDRSLWHHDEVAEALALLAPLTHAPPAPYLLQALIAAEHAVAPSSSLTAWYRIVDRYDELLTLADSPIVRLNRAVAVAAAEGAESGLAALESIALPGHRLPAVRAQLLSDLGRTDEALRAFDAAIALCTSEPERAHLRVQRAQSQTE